MNKPIVLQSAKVTTRHMHESTTLPGGSVALHLDAALAEIDEAVNLLVGGGAWAVDGECEIIIHVSQKMKPKENPNAG